ncbi:helix-turn-helix domain-containing protein [Pseudoduganella lurida]|uniref:helix-turn-helix domain-containing protein n=1 Tax=Pseudoduganella lurida TaxID=1036180 RepID=UPI0013152BAE
MEKTITHMLKSIKDTSGWSEPRIAERLNTSQPTVNRILRGQSDCRATTYLAITDLYTELCAPRDRRAED